MRLPRRSSRDRPTGRPASGTARPSGTRTSGTRRPAPSRRPAVQRSTTGPVARPRETDVARARRTGLTARAAVLAVALCAVVLTLAVPLQQYVSQRGHINALAAQTRVQAQRVSALELARKRWHDPAYIREQARERLHFVEPGETAYVVVAPKSTVSATPRVASDRTTTTDAAPWYSQLWRSVVAAGSPPAPSRTESTHQRRARPAPINGNYAHPKG